MKLTLACFGVELSIQVQPDFMLLEPATPYHDYLCFVFFYNLGFVLPTSQVRKVCQRVPQKVVETQTMTRPTWKWEQRCDNITFQRTEYYTETEVPPHVKNIMVTKTF